jgi:hypothetical protein
MLSNIRWIVWLGCFFGAASCASGGGNETNAGMGGGVGGLASSAGAGAATQAPVGSPCPADNLTQPCSCLDNNGKTVAGRQTCNFSVGWNACECAAIGNGAADGAGDRNFIPRGYSRGRYG